MRFKRDYLTNVVVRDMFEAFIGDKVGFGFSRRVYRLRGDASKVVKIETISGHFQNAAEWGVWNCVKHEPDQIAKWFTPCHYISPCGIFLIQDRTDPVRDDEFPAKIPAMFTDLKRQNWGSLNGKFVCHDYGILRVSRTGMTNRLVKADWWGET